MFQIFSETFPVMLDFKSNTKAAAAIEFSLWLTKVTLPTTGALILEANLIWNLYDCLGSILKLVSPMRVKSGEPSYLAS